MRITLLGGTETVTGSKFLLETDTTKVLIDCGLFQGYKWLRERNWQTPPFDIDSLDAVVLTHAHLDHSGYIPVLYKHGYRRPVYTHHATKALCDILLPDSGHIQEEDAKYFGKHKLSRHAHPEPLYDQMTAEHSMTLFEGVNFGESFGVGDIRFHLQPAGHILGAASIIVECEGKTVGFSGDVGRPDDLLTYPPQPLPAVDMLFLESTYGNRRHEEQNPAERLKDVVNDTVRNGGVLLIPSFAVGRAQALQHLLASLMAAGDIPRLPVYLDSPMAIDVSEIFCRFSDIHRLSREQCHLMCESITYTRQVDESKALAGQTFPHIIIAGSGMATGGRILHHFMRLLGNPRTTVLFTGYQAGGTRGAKMLAGAESVKIFGSWIPLRAKVEMIDGLSAHADYVEMHQWLSESELKPSTQIQLIHGDPDALEGQRIYLQEHTPYTIHVPDYRSILRL